MNYVIHTVKCEFHVSTDLNHKEKFPREITLIPIRRLLEISDSNVL